eukprot:2740053-Rhodomonas_salina.1
MARDVTRMIEGCDEKERGGEGDVTRRRGDVTGGTGGRDLPCRRSPCARSESSGEEEGGRGRQREGEGASE